MSNSPDQPINAHAFRFSGATRYNSAMIKIECNFPDEEKNTAKRLYDIISGMKFLATVYLFGLLSLIVVSFLLFFIGTSFNIGTALAYFIGIFFLLSLLFVEEEKLTDFKRMLMEDKEKRNVLRELGKIEETTGKFINDYELNTFLQ